MSIRKTRNVSLTPELEAVIHGRGVAARYRSAREVVRAALRPLEQEVRRRQVPGDLAKAEQKKRSGAR